MDAKTLFLLLTVELCACQPNNNSQSVTKIADSVAARPDSISLKVDTMNAITNAPASKAPAERALKDIYDSILAQKELTREQIRKFISIDSIYYTGPNENATFTGDTMWNLHQVKVIILTYNDHQVCLNKDMIVRSPDGDEERETISTGCDRDLSAWYFTTQYRLLTDSTFETTRSAYPPDNEEEPDLNHSERLKWTIHSDGSMSHHKLKYRKPAGN